MVLYLPRNLAALAKLTRDDPRYALAGIHVLDPGDTTYRVEATDGRRLAVVRGNSNPDLDYPTLDVATPGTSQGIIPADVWEHCFRKLPGKDVPKDGCIGLALGESSFTFGTPSVAHQGSFLDGRYPAVDDVLPRALPVVEIVVNPKFLAGLLDVAVALGCERVRLLYFGKEKLLGVSGHNESGQFLDGVLVPLS